MLGLVVPEGVHVVGRGPVGEHLLAADSDSLVYPDVREPVVSGHFFNGAQKGFSSGTVSQESIHKSSTILSVRRTWRAKTVFDPLKKKRFVL